MLAIKNKSLILDFIEKYSSAFHDLDTHAFKDVVYDPDAQHSAAALVDEGSLLGIDFNDLSIVMSEVNRNWGAEQVKRLRILACLHPDSEQPRRLADYRKAATAFSTFYGVKIDIDRIDLSSIHENESALKDASYLFGISDVEWLSYILKNDVAALAYTRAVEHSTLKKSDIVERLDNNPNIRKLFYNTSNHFLKDLSKSCTMAFMPEFRQKDFIKAFNPDIPHDILLQHGEMVLAACFRKAYVPMRMGAALCAEDGQQEAMKQVLRLFTQAGVDWFKPWAASRDEMYPMALADLQGESFTNEEIARAFVMDDRNFSLTDDSIVHACRRVIISEMPEQALISIYKNEPNRDEMMEFFYGETGSATFLNHITNPETKRDILSTELGM